MSADQNKEKGSTTAKTSEKTRIEVSVDSEQMKRLLADLEKRDKEAEELAKKLKVAQEAKEKAEGALEEKTTESEDYRNKLALIAEAKINAKRKIIMEKAKEVIKDEARLKKIEEGMKDAKGVQATEFMIETLTNTLAEGKKQREELLAKKKLDETRKVLLEEFPDAKDKIEGAENLEALENLRKELTPVDDPNKKGGAVPADKKGATGTIPLSSAKTDTTGEGYDSYQAMIQDLRRMEHSDNPEEAAYAKEVLDEMFRKWSVAVKKRYENKSKGLVIDPTITEGLKQPPLKEMTKLTAKEKK